MDPSQKLGRRHFLQATAGGALLSAAAAAQSSRPVRFGLIGCGGRGRYLSRLLVESGRAQLVALADLFEDRVTAAKQQFDPLLQKRSLASVEAARLYQGPDAFQRLASSDVDAVVIAITPYFYPQVLEQVVPLGKHIYSEKPVATDVAGCLKVMDLAHRINGRYTFHVGFQLPYNPALKELVRRVHAGAIGNIVTAEAYFYYGGSPRVRPANMSYEQARVRLWGGDRILSGDIIVEQNVHTIDKLNWVLQAHPVAAVATGGRKARADFGNVWDHYNAIIQYPGDIIVSFRSTQFLKGWNDVGERFFGTKGVSESHYQGPVRIYGDEAWDSGVTDIRSEAEQHKIRAFLDDIQTGKFRNEALRGAESTLSAILVRTAAYQGRQVTWDALLSSNESWDPHIDLKRIL